MYTTYTGGYIKFYIKCQTLDCKLLYIALDSTCLPIHKTLYKILDTYLLLYQIV